MERALALREKTLGSNHPYVAESLSSLAFLYSEMDDYVRARPLYERALSIYEEKYGPDHSNVATCLNNIALLTKEIGDHAGARPLYERALAIREKALGPEHPGVAQSLNNLARLFQEMGDDDKARSFFERALAIYEKAFGPEHDMVAVTLNNLGSLLSDRGDYDNAEAFIRRAMAIREKTIGADHHRNATVLNNLATLLRERGDYADARLLFERALAIKEKALTSRHPDLAQILGNLGGLRARTGDIEEGLEACLRAERISREHFILTARILAERQALLYASARESSLDRALSIAGSGLAAGSGWRVWDTLTRSRALVLDEMASRQKIAVASGDPELDALFEGCDAARRRLANLTVRGPGGKSPERYRALLEGAREEKEKAEQALAEKSAVFREERAKRGWGLEDIASSLPPESVLVGYARYRGRGAARGERIPDGEEGGGERGVASSKRGGAGFRYLAFVLRHGGKEVSVVPLGGAEEIEALVSEWRREASSGIIAHGDSPGEAVRAYRAAGRALAGRVWAPLSAYLEGAERVFVVPDGALHLVSLAALPAGGDGYLVEEGPLIHYLSAERDLVPPAGTGKRGEGLLVLGDPAFDETSLFASLIRKRSKKESLATKLASLISFRGERSGCGDFRSLRFEALPGTGKEAGEVSSVWRRSVSTGGGSGRIVHLKGAGANEIAFKKEAPGKRVLHLATHGFFLGGKCEPAGESVRGIAGSGTEGTRELLAATGDNPLLLSGLALSGFNNREAAGADEEDGVLTAEEIAAMDLGGVGWAVLSACGTGVGEIKAGEGVFGLRRAFQVAGVRTLIMSLWSVDDEATREWMRALYEARFIGGAGTAESVREASLAVLKKRREKGKSTHPFYWGAFVAAGDWK